MVVLLYRYLTEGSQIRSRSVISPATNPTRPCDTTLVESRQCTGGVCVEYSWRTSDRWYANRREVWCERDLDGLRVFGKLPRKQLYFFVLKHVATQTHDNPPTGACDPSTRPSSTRGCANNCSNVIHAQCSTAANRCECASGFKATQDAEGLLTSCSRIPITDYDVSHGILIENRSKASWEGFRLQTSRFSLKSPLYNTCYDNFRSRR